MRRCGGEWGPSTLRRQTLSSPQLVEFNMSEREVPITIAQRLVLMFRSQLATDAPPSFYDAGLKNSQSAGKNAEGNVETM